MRNYHDFASVGGGLLCERVYLVEPIKLNAVESTYAPALFDEFATTFVDSQMDLSCGIREGGGITFRWTCQCCGFKSGEAFLDNNVLGKFRGTFWFIPYWTIVFPLTLFSAFLLLSQPRRIKKAETLPSTAV